jgi:hypothetical protein
MIGTYSNLCGEKDMHQQHSNIVPTLGDPVNYTEHAKIFQTAQMWTNKLAGEIFLQDVASLVTK